MPFTKEKNTTEPSLERQDANTKVVAVVHRHPFGILVIYLQMFVGLAAAGLLIYLLMPSLVNREDNPGAYVLVGVVMLVLAAFMVVVMLIATVIYRQSKLIMTDKDITEVTQEGLFNRRIAQLNVSNIEDATADRRGVFQTLLNFGILNIETAGETDNFYFHYCPEPDKYAKVVLQLRENFLSNRERDNVEAGMRYASAGLQQAMTNSTQAAGSSPPTQQNYQPQPPYEQSQQPYQQQQADPATTVGSLQNDQPSVDPYAQPVVSQQTQPDYSGNNAPLDYGQSVSGQDDNAVPPYPTPLEDNQRQYPPQQ